MPEQLIKPTFIIPGAAKAGTTSIYYHLRHHPDVFMSDYKEPSFFCMAAAQLYTDEKKYYQLFEKASGAKMIGEASVAYLYDPTSAERIYKALGSIKIVIFIRNPVSRAYSMWAHNVRQGYENLPFRKALDAESRRISDLDRRINGVWVGNLAYVDRGRYVPQVTRYFRTFGKENVRVYVYEQFFRQGLPKYSNLCRFLGIASDHIPEVRVHNRAGLPRSILFRELLRRKLLIKEPFKLLIPESKRRSIKRFLYNLNQKEVQLPPMDDLTRAAIENETREDVRQLEKILGMNLREYWFE